MYLAARRIRSAGRSTGSIEITLPVELARLEGAECRVMLRDGPRPEVVVQPDISPTQALVRDLWERLRLGLGEAGDTGDFSPSDFSFAFFLPTHWQERPPLAYADALAVLQQGPGTGGDPAPLARLMACLAVVAANRLELKGALALGFGEGIAYIMAGAAAGLGRDFERAMSHRIFWEEGGGRPLGSPLDDQTWRQARPGLRKLYEQFRLWHEQPEWYVRVRDRWYKAVQVEVGVRLGPAEGYKDPRRQRRR